MFLYCNQIRKTLSLKAILVVITSISLLLILMAAIILNDYDFRKLLSGVRKKPRIFCMITTQPENHDIKAIHIKATWGKRCDVLLFLSTESDPSLPAIKICNTEDRDHLWCKTKHGFRYAYDHFADDADWFLKADDDTYVIVENLKYFLSDYNENVPIYFGCKFRSGDTQLYMSGGAGFVLSKAALKLFVKNAISSAIDSIECKALSDTGAEDAELGRCLTSVGVIPGDSRDSLGRGRFFPMEPHVFMYPYTSPIEFAPWWQNKSYYSFKQGYKCCSDTTVTFHYVKPQDMYVIDFFLYHIRVAK